MQTQTLNINYGNVEVTCLKLVLVRIWKHIYNKGGGNRGGSGTFMSNTIIKELKISVE